MNISTQDIFFIFLFILAISAAYSGTHRVSQGTIRIIERFGKFNKILPPGIHFVIPFLDSAKPLDFMKIDRSLIKKVQPIDSDAALSGYLNADPRIIEGKDLSMKEFVLDPVPYNVIAGDNAVVWVNVIAFVRVSEPTKAVYNVANLIPSLTAILETTVRQEAARLNSDTIITSRDVISARLVSALADVSDTWGIKVTRVEVQEIRFADDSVQNALSRAREEELERRATVVKTQADRDRAVIEAEGVKQKAILEAEGFRQSEILKAEAEFETKRLNAEGDYLLRFKELEGIANGYAAIGKAFADNPSAFEHIKALDIAVKALKAQESVAASIGNSNNTLILPTELAGLMGALGAVRKAIEFTDPKKA